MRLIPNILSCLRVAMFIAFIIMFIKGQYAVCLALYIAAFVTDILDGFLARKFNWVSNFGKLVDPFADKFMFVSALACLVAIGKFPWYLLVILVVKEILLIIGGLIVLKKRKTAVFADMWGKVATFLMFMSVTLTLVNLAFNEFIPGIALMILYFTAVAVSVISFFHYAYLAGFIGKKYRSVSAYEEQSDK